MMDLFPLTSFDFRVNDGTFVSNSFGFYGAFLSNCFDFWLDDEAFLLNSGAF